MTHPRLLTPAVVVLYSASSTKLYTGKWGVLFKNAQEQLHHDQQYKPDVCLEQQWRVA